MFSSVSGTAAFKAETWCSESIPQRIEYAWPSSQSKANEPSVDMWS